MKAILISIQARHNRNIEAGKKISELRNRIPQCAYPIKVYTYESGKEGRRKVVNEWVCESVDTWNLKQGIPIHLPKAACVGAWEIREYRDKKRNSVSEMHISNLKIYDTPRELGEFKTPEKWSHMVVKHDNCLTFIDGYVGGKPLKRAPQSWQYVEEIEE